MRPLVALVLVAPALAGCLAGAGAGLEVAPYVDLQAAEPGGRTEFAILLRAEREAEVPLEIVTMPGGWRASFEAPTARAGPAGTTTVLTVRPAADATYGLHYVWFRAGPREGAVAVSVEDLGDVALRPGIGALVRTAGFWDNGTLFYTNMKEVRDNPYVRAHDAGADATEADFEPLKVYVGGKRGERPPEPYNASGYVPVIEGFDQRLRGMREGETFVARIPPELAYTRPGNEDHFLYGDALNFVVQVARVDDLGAPPACGLPVCPPERDDVPALRSIVAPFPRPSTG